MAKIISKHARIATVEEPIKEIAAKKESVLEVTRDNAFDIYYVSKSGKKTLVFSKKIAQALEEQELFSRDGAKYKGSIDEI